MALVTVEEAGVASCPYARATSEKALPEAERVAGKCLAESCMGWRWSRVRASGSAASHLGYCGLAGDPGPLP